MARRGVARDVALVAVPTSLAEADVFRRRRRDADRRTPDGRDVRLRALLPSRSPDRRRVWDDLATAFDARCDARLRYRRESRRRRHTRLPAAPVRRHYVGSTLLFSSLVTVTPPAWLTNVLISLSVVLPLAAAHAVVRKRVLDVNFAVSRALVYGALTACLAATFEFLDWLFGTVLDEFRLSRLFEAAISVAIAFALDSVHGRGRSVFARLRRAVPACSGYHDARRRQRVAARAARRPQRDPRRVVAVATRRRPDRRRVPHARRAAAPARHPARIHALRGHTGCGDLDPQEIETLEHLAHGASGGLDVIDGERVRAAFAEQRVAIAALEARVDETSRARQK